MGSNTLELQNWVLWDTRQGQVGKNGESSSKDGLKIFDATELMLFVSGLEDRLEQSIERDEVTKENPSTANFPDIKAPTLVSGFSDDRK